MFTFLVRRRVADDSPSAGKTNRLRATERERESLEPTQGRAGTQCPPLRLGQHPIRLQAAAHRCIAQAVAS